MDIWTGKAHRQATHDHKEGMERRKVPKKMEKKKHNPNTYTILEQKLTLRQKK